jgi:CrcB protein
MPLGLFVAIAGALGALARYGVDDVFGDHMAPNHQVPATLFVNLLGSLLLGLLVGVHPHDGRVRVVLGVGFLGAFTTFSTLAYQTYHGLDTTGSARALLLPLVSVVAGVLAVAVGIAVGQRVP